MINRLYRISEEELSNITYLSNEQCIIEIEKNIKAKAKIKRTYITIKVCKLYSNGALMVLV